jgi:hypothetical protein
MNFNCTFYLIERLRSKAWRGTVEETGGPEGREESNTSEHSRSRQIDLTNMARLTHLQVADRDPGVFRALLLPGGLSLGQNPFGWPILKPVQNQGSQ